MIEQAVERLQALAQSDVTAAPLAMLQATALRAAAAPAWAETVPVLDRSRAQNGLPLLHGDTLVVESERVRRLLLALAAAAVRGGTAHAEPLRRVLNGGVRRASSHVDALAVLEASIVGDSKRLESLAADTDVDPILLATLGHLAALPLLLACGQKAAPLLEGLCWDAGYCPVCAAWPTLAELRGLERKRWLRCGRCGSGWTLSQRQCVFCGNTDHRTQGYLAAEGEAESRRATTCERCRGYLKTLSTISPLAPTEIGLRDLSTLELDVAAIEQEYGRPAAPGFPLELHLAPAPSRHGWLPWR